MKHKVLLLTVTLFSVLKVFGYDFEIRESHNLYSQSYCYNIIGEGEVELAKYGAYASDYYNLPDVITIPGEVLYDDKTYQVVSLGKEAFKDNTRIWTVYLPYTIQRIENGCFNGAKELRTVRLIGEGTNNVTYIGNEAFWSCNSLYDINVIGESLTYIGSTAFGWCTNLISVRIPDSVTYLGNRAFYNCRRMISATIGSGLKNIPSEAFSGCVAMKSLKIYSGVQSIGNSAFEETPISEVRIPDTVKEINEAAFRKCMQLSSVILSNALTSISKSTFSGCTKLSEITIPASVKKIDISAFYGCENLRKVEFADPSSLTEIGDGAFLGTKLSNITIPNSVLTIGTGCFQYSSLLSITLGSSLTSIGDIAFSGCESLRQIFSYSMVPPEISFTTFSEKNYDNTVLKVPVEAVSDYSTHMVWGLFRNIVGVEGAGLNEIVNEGNKTIDSIYTISGILIGKEVDQLPKGYYVVKYKDNSVSKLYVK